MRKELLVRELEDMKKRFARSAWDKGVYDYAFDILEPLGDELENVKADTLMNGANTWTDYSYGGCALICDDDIAKRMCTPSEYKKYLNATPNSKLSDSDYWLGNVQTRALFQAMLKICSAYTSIIELQTIIALQR